MRTERSELASALPSIIIDNSEEKRDCGKTMMRIGYHLPNYPTLSFTSRINVLDGPQPAFTAFIQAEGLAASDRKGWGTDFKRWCTGYGQIPVAGKPTRSLLRRCVTLESISVVAAFIIEWVGLDWVDHALQEVKRPPQDLRPDLQALRDEVREISKSIEKIEERATLADYRLWAAARGMLGLTLPPVDLTSNNWDFMFDPESEPQVEPSKSD
jgi:hypothetical protein